MSVIKIGALIYVVIYYGVLLVLRSYLLYQKTGVNPVKKMKKTGLEGFIEKVFFVLFILVSVVALNFVFIEKNYVYFVPITYLETASLGLIGMVIAFFGLTVGFIAQLQMGDSWRLGVDQEGKTALVEKGLFSLSRNPVYLGILVANVGFFLMMPSAMSFTMLVLYYVCLGIKIRLEETHLMKQHEGRYLEYQKKVRRWL